MALSMYYALCLCYLLKLYPRGEMTCLRSLFVNRKQDLNPICLITKMDYCFSPHLYVIVLGAKPTWEKVFDNRVVVMLLLRILTFLKKWA